MSYLRHVLPNGIKVVYSPSGSRVSHLGVLVNAGSRDELVHEHGIAHFIEHMAFKGTTRRKAFHVLSRLDNVGGDLNAFTTKEHTCLYASFLSEYTARAVELFADIILHSVFPQKEIEKEKSVILDEINAYLDTPSEQIFDDFEEMLFKGHPISRNILGTPENLKNITKQQIIRFIQRNYSASGTVISYIGSYPFHKLILLLERFFHAMEDNHFSRQRMPFNAFIPSYMSIGKDTHQTHVMTGTLAYPLGHPSRTGLQLLNNLLGGPASNSRLNMALRERKGLTYHVESNYQAYTDTGYLSIYMGTPLSDPAATIAQAWKEMSRLKNQKLGSLQLFRAKKQIAGQIALAYESRVNEMLSIGAKCLHNLALYPIEQIIACIDAVSASDLQDIANELFQPERFSTLIFKSESDHE